MALKGKRTHISGVELPEAYIKVASIFIHPIDRLARFQLNVYRDQQARESDLPVFESFENAVYGDEYDSLFSTAKLDEINMNAIKKVYEHIKALPEYSGYTDI